MNNFYHNWKIKHAKVPITFIDPIKLKDIMSKRGNCHGLSLCKALKEEEVEKQQWRQAESMKQAWLKQYSILFMS